MNEPINEVLYAQAETLAKLNWDICLEKDVLSNGDIYHIARNPELPGCMADGSTSDESVANLRDARADYLYALLVLGYEIPDISGKNHIFIEINEGMGIS